VDHTKVDDAGIAKLTGLARLLSLELDSVERPTPASRTSARSAA